MNTKHKRKGLPLVQVFLLVLSVSFVFALFTLDTLASATPGGVAGVAPQPSSMILTRVSESARTRSAPVRTGEVANITQSAWNEGNLAASRVMDGMSRVVPADVRTGFVRGVTNSHAALRGAWYDVKYWVTH